MLKIKSRLLAASVLVSLTITSGSLYAFNPKVDCDYEDKTVSKVSGTITSTRNHNKKAANYGHDRRICVVSFDARINNKWQKTHASYIFGPNMSENQACNKASERARVKALEKYAPTHIISEAQSVCVEQANKPKPEPRIVYRDRVVEKKVYVTKPSDSRNYKNRKHNHTATNGSHMMGPASCYRACVKGDCRCYDALLEQRKRDNSLFGFSNNQLLSMFNWGQLVVGQFVLRN